MSPSSARVIGIDFGSKHISVAVRYDDGSIQMVDTLPTGIQGHEFGKEMPNVVHVDTVSHEEPRYKVGIRGMDDRNFESFKSEFCPVHRSHHDTHRKKLRKKLRDLNSELKKIGHKPVDICSLLNLVLDRVMRAVKTLPTSDKPLQGFFGVPNYWFTEGKDRLRRLLNGAAKANGIEIDFVPKTESEASAKWYFEVMGSHGENITVCDIGGSSIDIVTYKLTGETTLSQSIPAEGQAYGGNDVDAKFREYVGKCYPHLSKGVDNCLNPVLGSFTTAKSNFTGEEKVPFEVFLNGEGVKLSRAEMVEFYQPVVAPALHLISKQLKDVGKGKLMLLGRPAANKYLRGLFKEHVKQHHPAIEVSDLDERLEPQLPEAVARGLVSQYSLASGDQILGQAVGVGFIEDAEETDGERMIAENVLWVFAKGSPLLFNTHTIWLTRDLPDIPGESFSIGVKVYSTTKDRHMRPFRQGQFPELKGAKMTPIRNELLGTDIFVDGAAHAEVPTELFETRDWAEDREVYYIQHVYLDEGTILRLEIYVWKSATPPGAERMGRHISDKELRDESLFACVRMKMNIAFRQYAATGNDQHKLLKRKSTTVSAGKPKKRKTTLCLVPAKPVSLKNGEILSRDYLEWWWEDEPSKNKREDDSLVMIHGVCRFLIHLVFERHDLFSDVSIERGVILDPDSKFDISKTPACQADVLHETGNLLKEGFTKDVTIIPITVGSEQMFAVIVARKGKFFNVYSNRRAGPSVTRLENWSKKALESLRASGSNYGDFDLIKVATASRHLTEAVTAVIASVIQAAKIIREINKEIDFGYRFAELKTFLKEEISCVASAADHPDTET